jgi:DNA-binding NtrC family response regulator
MFVEITEHNNLMNNLLHTVGRIAVSDLGVLIVGEPGTGKKWLARLIHQMSGRSDYLLRQVNCSNIHQDAIEQEIFGYETITLAGVQMMEGALEQSNGGTIFFDQISELPLVTQAKVVRALDHKYFQRIGGYEEVNSNVRIIASILNKSNEVQAERNIHKDLYYRITPIVLNLPPLRERKEHIPSLIENFILYSEASGKINSVKGISADAMRMCLLHDWPGNIQELKDAVEFAGLMCDDQLIRIYHFPGYLQRISEEKKEEWNNQLAKNGESLERMLIEHALKHSRTKKEAAEQLGISVSTFSNKLSRYNLQVKFVN